MTRPVTEVPWRMTTRPSMTMSEAMVPVKVSPCWVVALSRVWVMRMGMVVPELMVMLWKVGAGGVGGGGGGAAGRSCAGGGGGGTAATSGAGVSTGGGGGGVLRTTGAGFGLMAGVCFGLGATGEGGG